MFQCDYQEDDNCVLRKCTNVAIVILRIENKPACRCQEHESTLSEEERKRGFNIDPARPKIYLPKEVKDALLSIARRHIESQKEQENKPQ